jgi:hypothetical protein
VAETPDDVIRDMRQRGHGFTVIARTLNERGIPTSSGRGQWWPATVRAAITPGYWAGYMRAYRRRPPS